MLATSDNKDRELLKKISTTELALGMYVQELDRPWVETPFLFQGFKIRNQKEIDLLTKNCEYVYIDVERGADVPHNKMTSPVTDRPAVQQPANIAGSSANRNAYPDTTSVEEELANARVTYENSYQSVENIFHALKSDGTVNLPEIRAATSGIVESVLRNPDAFLLLHKLKTKDEYSYSHSVNCCALAATFCRHLGFPQDEIREMAMGALMLDIGNVKLPDAILKKQGPLTEEMFAQVRRHVNHGIELLNGVADIPATLKDMVITHHERVNGKGYPHGLKGEQIPLSGRIAGIVDCFVAMTSERPYKRPITPHEAICELYKFRNVDFNEDLVEQFIQCLGVYPTSTLVELSSGQVGIILSQNRVRRLYPKVLLILNADRVPYEKPHTLDLWEHAQKSRGNVLDIKRALDPDALGIDPADYYL